MSDKERVVRRKLEDRLFPLPIGARLCLESRLELPALVLIYSGIDTAGWLGNQGDLSAKQSFISWADRYLIPNSDLTCSSLDLYSARCGLLHTLTADSSLIARGEARPIYYAWGTGEPSELRRLAELVDQDEELPAIVHVGLLLEAFAGGLNRFIGDVVKNADKLATVERKLRRIFAPLAATAVTEMLQRFEGQQE